MLLITCTVSHSAHHAHCYVTIPTPCSRSTYQAVKSSKKKVKEAEKTANTNKGDLASATAKVDKLELNSIMSNFLQQDKKVRKQAQVFDQKDAPSQPDAPTQPKASGMRAEAAAKWTERASTVCTHLLSHACANVMLVATCRSVLICLPTNTAAPSRRQPRPRLSNSRKIRSTRKARRRGCQVPHAPTTVTTTYSTTTTHSTTHHALLTCAHTLLTHMLIHQALTTGYFVMLSISLTSKPHAKNPMPLRSSSFATNSRHATSRTRCSGIR